MNNNSGAMPDEADKARIRELESIARRLEPGAAERTQLTTQVLDYAERFLETLDEAPVYVAGAPGRGFGARLGEQPAPVAELLRELGAEIDTPGINPASGGHLGYIPGGGIFHAALGDYLADIANRYSGINFASPGAAQLERSLVNWMAGLIGFGEEAGGDLTSGGSIANLSAIVAAREAHGLRSADVATSCIYLTSQAHHCVTKAIGIAGLRDARLRIVPMDRRWRLDASELAGMVADDRRCGLRPWLVIASAGTTDTGAIDPLPGVAEVARDHGLWLHVDAAYGGCFLLCDEGREKLDGIARADSVAIDPHKGLFLPYGSGALIVRDVATLAQAFSYEANYMQDATAAEDRPSPASLSPELTRPFRGLRMWLPLKLLGLAPFRAAVEEKLHLARWFHARLSGVPGFEVGPAPELSVVTYRYLPRRGDADAFNRRLCRAVQRDGEVFISSTTLDGRFTLRLAVLNFRTHLHHVERLLGLLEHHARRLEASGEA